MKIVKALLDRADRPRSVPTFVPTIALALALAQPGIAQAQVIASDMVGSASQNLLSYANPWTDAFGSAGDGFQKYQRGVSATIPFSLADDSLSIFPGDSLGIIKQGNTDVFFGVTDTVNGDTSGPVSATWVFNIAGTSNLELAIDMGAMGDFESSDFFEWSYSIDGGANTTAFASTVDESGSHTYTLEGGASFTLNDPMLMQGTILTNDLQTFVAAIAGSGNELSLTLTASTDGGSEAFAFQNIEIRVGSGSPPGVAYDMVDSGDLNLLDYINPWTDVFGSPGDGFQKYQRGVSPSIPFAVVDDSLSIFPTDGLGIIKEGNTDVFFGVVDTVNGDNSSPVSASWVFNISGASGLGLLVDIGAMGDFETSDFFEWTYSIDGGPELTAFSSTVDEAGSYTYTLEGGSSFTLNDPMLVQGEILTNDLATFSTALTGTGSALTVTLTASFNGGSEAVVFQNLVVGTGFEPPPPLIREIFEIQGDGAASTYAGLVVESQANIVTAVAGNGFFMQTPETRTDGNVDTSDGIFVFTGGAPGVLVGDLVDVTGTVEEFFGFTEIADSPTVTVLNSAQDVPAPVTLDATVPSPDPAAPSCAIEYECYEGMLVAIANGVVGGPNQRFGSDPIAEVYISAAGERPFREPGVEYPGLGIPGIATWDGNPEVFELDPNKLGLDNRIIPAGSTFDAIGIMGFEFGGYELWPVELNVDAAAIPAAVRDRARAELTIGSLNMFRLFDDVDDPADGDRNDQVVSAEEYERRQAKLAAYVVDVLKAPDVLAVQEVEKLGVLEDLAAVIASRDPDIVYAAYLEEGNDIGTIDVGFLVRDNVAVDAITQINKDEIFAYDGSLLNDRPPLLLEGRSINEGADYPFAVINVHGRSLSGIGPGDGGQERVRLKRLAQAESLAQAIQALQDADPDIRLVVTGDFNAFEFSDGFVDVLGVIRGDVDPTASLEPGSDYVDPDLINQVLAIDAAERYSFIFRGSAQVLDHALTSMALDASIRGFGYGRGNADAAVDLINDATTPLRSSDHDGLVLFLTKDKDDDGVNDDADVCPGTVIPEMLDRELGTNRFALTDADFDFDTSDPNGNGPGRSYSTVDTAGCSCNQVVDALGLGNGHKKFGCSIGVLDNWVKSKQ